MRNCEIACFIICATPRCTIAVQENLNAEAMQLTATVRKSFVELGV